MTRWAYSKSQVHLQWNCWHIFIMARRLSEFCVLYFFYLNGATSKDCKIRKFPTGFMFGAATSAYQIEGAWNVDGKGRSIWDVATHQNPSPIIDDSTGDVAADSYKQYKRDIELIKELGINIYRFSISWSRILPNGWGDKINQAGVDYYNKLIDELEAADVKPFVTMYHWDLPVTLQKLGGWTNPQILNWFSDYAKILFEKFGDKVQYWITINDPKQICLEGYGSDGKAPFLNMSGYAEYLCAKNILLAHAKTYIVYDEKFRKLQNGKIGISVSCTWYEPASDSSDDINAAADARMFDWGIYLNPIFSRAGDFPSQVRRNVGLKSAEQGYPRSRFPKLTSGEKKDIKGSADFLGIIHYTTKMAYRDASLDGMYPVPSFMDDMAAVLVKDPNWSQAKSPWLQEVSWGFRTVLKEINFMYNNPPVYITENGWSTSGGLLDDDRIRYLRNYMNAMLDAIKDGCDVKGYIVWSLIDGFEWRNGYTEKFGLYEVDFSGPELTRTPRKSSIVYRRIIKTHQLDPEFEPKYEPKSPETQQKEKEANDLF